MKTMNVETIEFKDVRGKQLLYLKITNNGKEVLINVGQKTFDSVKELETPTVDQAKLFVETEAGNRPLEQKEILRNK